MCHKLIMHEHTDTQVKYDSFGYIFKRKEERVHSLLPRHTLWQSAAIHVAKSNQILSPMTADDALREVSLY